MFRIFTSHKSPKNDWEAIEPILRTEKVLREKGEITPARRAGVIYRVIGSNAFIDNLPNEIDSILYDGAGSTKTSYQIKDDSVGMKWIVLEDGNFQDLVSSVYTVGNSISSNGGKNNLIAAVFEFYFSGEINEKTKKLGLRTYCIYRYDRRAFYPFVPTGNKEGDRDRASESVLANDMRKSGLNIETTLTEWMGLWGIPF